MSPLPLNLLQGIFKTASLLGLGALATGCGSSGKNLDAIGQAIDYEEHIGVYSQPSPDAADLDPVGAAAYWGTRYDQNPKDWNAAVNYSAALRKIGSIEQAVRVITAAAQRHGGIPEVAFETGKALLAAGRAYEAVRYLETASSARPYDWKAHSVTGVAYDQIGEHKAAQEKYLIAQSIAPDAVSILNNKGMSFALAGKIDKAVQVLRTAATRPGADARIRQNLALALAIRGDTQEAERLARSDLPPQIAEGNIEYFRSLAVQPAYWHNYAKDADAPDFDQTTAP